MDKAGWLFLTGAPGAIDATLKNFKLVRQREDDGSVDHVIGVFLLGPDGRELREYNGEIMKADTITADIDRVTVGSGSVGADDTSGGFTTAMVEAAHSHKAITETVRIFTI